MKLFLGVCLALAVAASAVEIRSPEPNSPVFGYHTRFGIPEAARIKKLEEDAVFNGQRIVGGSVTDISAIPYQAGLICHIIQPTNYESFCGGSLISHNRVVTAAHCDNDGSTFVDSFTVVLGSNTLFTGGIRITTRDVVEHPNYRPSTTENDIAILRISSVSYTDNIQPIALPSDNELSNNFNDVIAVASGYGLTSDGGSLGSNQRLSSVTVPVITNSACAAVFDPWVYDTTICTSGAGGRGVCIYDSGGPLVTTSNNRRILIGVTIFASRYNCAAGLPSGFVRVTAYVDWLQSQLQSQ